jgi:hypothetical protein
VEQWFDLSLHLTNWGSRRLMMRLPARLLDRAKLEPFLREVDWVKVWASGENLIVDICPQPADGLDDWDDGSGWLAALAPLRDDARSGDLRLFYSLWLIALQDELVADHEVEPLPGIGPLTGSLEAFAEFFGLDSDLLLAAAEQDSVAPISKDDLRATLASLSEGEKAELLLRVTDGDAHLVAEFRSKARENRPVSAARRTAGQIRIRAREIAEARKRAEAERREAERRHQAAEAEEARRARLSGLRQRGEGVWREIEDEIERRNASGYARAAGLLLDLQALAIEQGNQAEFSRRLASMRVRHERKGKFIERLAEIASNNDERDT